jgi:ribonucleoside-diphosphate reductase alpha chain
MGFADLLVKLGISYDSEEALRTAQEVMGYIQTRADEASEALAKERGDFPAWKQSKYGVSNRRMRNATRTTIAPTGTLSIIAGCSSGIEPLFALSYIRNILDNDRLIEVNHLFEDAARKQGFYSEELTKELAKRGSIKDMENIPQKMKRLFVIAHDISPEWHIRMQAAFQKKTNNAVSKTINFPHSATKEDVAEAYKLAYQQGCKGITIYRDRSKEKQVLSFGGEQKATASALVPRNRAKVTTGVIERVASGCGNIYVTVNSDQQGICEVFSSLGKAGGCASAQLEAICRLISLALRSGIDVASVTKHLKGIRCPSISWEEGHAILSCPDAIGGVLEKHLKGTPQITNPNGHKAAIPFGGQCPECGGMLVYQEGCNICMSCGYTKCSQGK